MHKDLSQIKL